jgi:hypothetical protein
VAEQRRLDDVALAYLSTFAGRTDAHSPWTGEQWIARREPLTPAVVIEAFRSKRPVGAYVAGIPDAEGRIATHLACLDVDIEPGGLLIADRIGRAMRKTGIPAYIEGSRRGGHLWVVLERPLPCPAIRRALKALIAAAGVEPDPKIELRPGQDRASSPDGLGNALRMPLMPHQTTGVAGELMEPGGKLVARKMAEAVLNVDFANPAIVEEWAQRWTPEIDPREIPHSYRRPRGHNDRDETSVVELLAELGVRAVPGRAAKCPFHDDNHPSLSIARDERRVFCKSPSCDAHGFNGKGLGSDQLRKLIGRRAA